jgi:uncharacterized protein (DUF427 family)
MTRPRREKPGPGQESVWDYPRPPRIELSERHIEIVFGGIKLADSKSARRVLETSHPPVYYIPEQDIRMECLSRAGGSSMCEWKGIAVYYDVRAGERTAARAAWSYPEPTPAFESLRACIAFYPALMDECYVDGERVRPQPGGFYGGWITRDIVGPFKGSPGTGFW